MRRRRSIFWTRPIMGRRGHVIGITGPPGVGKSTLIAALIKGFRKRGESVGVIAIDPSSRRSGGALLGDRVRIDTDPPTRASSSAPWPPATVSAAWPRSPPPPWS